MIIVTGGAGFIGSAVVWALNQRGRTDILLVDDIDHPAKAQNIAPLRYQSIQGIAAFRRSLATPGENRGARAVIHLGAIAATTETSWARLLEQNVTYSEAVIGWCATEGIRCVYASSAATYGAGKYGYSDDHALFDRLEPQNLYGKSKLLVDIWARDKGYLDQAVGLRYFNIFGPNEYHKGDMRSVITKKFERLHREGIIELFKSYRPDVADGEQQRDFMYVLDAVAATLFFLDHPALGGVYNVGSGTARTWNAVAHALAAALQQTIDIRYIDMPENIRPHYQYFTQADLSKLRAAGLTTPFRTLEEAVHEYVTEYLRAGRHLGEVVKART